MNKDQIVELVIRPTLKAIPKGYTDESVLAITMIIAHESKRGEYIKQAGTGPALGLIQMEPRTHDSTWKFGDSIRKNALKLGIITQYQYDRFEHPPAERLIYDTRYNVFMARQRLFMKKGALPKDVKNMSKYLKQHWNSAGGAADNYSYSDDYARW
ncbi:MAG: hypothetical protein MJK15_00720 [Colwellia sp.]|nr:hypothetical protein [Colwellia sp.]